MRTLTLLAALLLSACGGGGTTTQPTPSAPPPTTTEPSPTTDVPDDAIEVEAEDFTFSVGTITAAAGATVAIDFKNRDTVPHNLGFYLDEERLDAIFNGDTISGPDAETVYTFDAPAEAGTYFFQCDVHPDQMSGSFEVS